MSITISELLQHCEAGPGQISLEAPEDWMQGRSLYGGLQAALAIRAMNSLQPKGRLRCLQTNFMAPLHGKVRGQACVLRSGKNTMQIEAKLYAGDTLATQCLGIFGSSLDSKVEVQLSQSAVHSTSPLLFPFLPGVTPNFTQHFAMQLTKGNAPFTGKPTPTTVYQLDLHDDGHIGTEHVALFADVVPPLGLSYLSTPTFGSTMSWMLEFLAQPAVDESMQGWRLDSELVSADSGYTNQTNTLWSPSGQAIALSRQCMLVFG